LKKLTFLALLLFCPHGNSSPVNGEITNEIERIHSLRETLVTGVQGKVTKETFQAVCKPVGMELQKLAKSKGIMIKQASTKYRNPKNKPTSMELDIFNRMSNDANLVSLWTKSGEGHHYFRRIDVQKACLNCHGAKSNRPEFIKSKYKNDKAFGFKAGDLRAIYSVFIPN
tara:strand:- start:28316 stop:28825 length:510 start_codon:yes stop_codon:yes gene_type:complete